jgi:hypothetical protein
MHAENNPAAGFPQEKCARCNRPAPPPISGPEGQVAQGWVTYAESILIVDVPQEDSILPAEVANAIGAFDGLVKLMPDQQVRVPSILEVQSTYLGLACPECQAETGWDSVQWLLFLAGLDTSASDQEGGE